MAKTLSRQPIPLLPANRQVSQRPDGPVGKTLFSCFCLPGLKAGPGSMHKQPTWGGATIEVPLREWAEASSREGSR